MVIERRKAKRETARCISLSPVKMIAKWSFATKIMVPHKIPMKRDSMTVTMTEYLAALGCPDPSSLETRTLETNQNIRFVS